ncbi:hypothetical protein RBH29_04105 [Herbivorax sp. ANBcel31]|uniref:hypothetical protein n=1 Tax=Herbivorax sp. ANBcel31 TaxID=3069754 RepID=UPI0027B14F33|nr:hypothetical protein [Herbivorax sp. ANBcel31]MDQ2085617.1 hypothetical protein [Herbivorax sp. ANBcel31]
MFNILKRSKNLKNKFDRKVLKKNNISILILDERWNSLFKNIKKTDKIIRIEKELINLLKEEARLNSEFKEISNQKKKCLNKIIELTPKVFEENNENSRIEMESCEKSIKKINQRFEEIGKEIEIIPDKIKDKNLELLESTVNTVYFKMRKNQKRLKELENLIDQARKSLESYIDEKGELSEDDTDIYTYFHDLIGKEELEKLDKEYFEK